MEARLYSTATTLQALPDEGISEFAVVGRSNVGKSTLLNRITGRKKLAYTSSTPGKTQSFHSYQVQYKNQDGDKDTIHLVDLPGFGYAKFAKRKREYISRLTLDYILHRHCLRGLFLLNDIRREPADDELAIQQVAFEAEIPLIIVLTKADKIKRSQIKKRQEEIAKQYNLEPSDLIITGEKYPIKELWNRVSALS